MHHHAAAARCFSLLSLVLGLALPPFAAQAQVVQLRPAFIDSLIDAEYPATGPGGVVLVARKGEVLYERAFGLMNVEHGIAMRPDAVFCIASLTKQFTAITVLQQVEKGTIALSDTVGKFLPTLPPALTGITIEQLLLHTSGVANPRNVASLVGIGRGWLAADAIVSAFKDQPLDFPPGSRWAYSNSGYQLLGYIMEKVTGEPYPQFIEKTLLVPAGMTESFWGNDMRIVPNRAYAYLHTRNGLQNAVNANVQIAWAAGALQATARDFLKWHQALLAGRLVAKPTLQKAWTRGRLTNGTQTDYGYGWFIGELQGAPTVEHSGNMGGFMSHVMYLPREDVLVEVFLNSRGKRLPELIATDIAAAVIGRPLDIRAITLPGAELESYAGMYKDNQGTDVAITLEDGRLFYQKTGGPKWAVTPHGKDRVFFDNTSTLGEFRRDASGAITGFAMQTRTGMSKNLLTRTPPAR